MRIELLADHLDLASTVAIWHANEWDGAPEERTEHYRRTTGRGRIPITFLAFDGEEVVGSASLVAQDMDSHPELSPWLASVFVIPSARGRGFARAVVSRTMECARELGYRRIYLFTHTARGLYEKLGWQVIGEEDYEGHREALMALDFPPSAPS